jgi:metallo-beta-lactamase class B
MDRILKDGDTVELGGVTLVAHLTVGHTQVAPHGRSGPKRVAGAGRGCGQGLAARRGAGERHGVPQFADDFRRSFAKMRTLKADVFVGSFVDFSNDEVRQTCGRADPMSTREATRV